MIHCNTGFVLHYNILLMQPFRVSSVDIGCQAELCNPRMLLYSILYAFASSSILAYSTQCINANIYHGIRATFRWPWFSILMVYLRAIFVFLGVFFSLRSSSLASYCCRQNSPIQSSHHQKLHQQCKTIAFLKLPSQSQTSFKGSSQPYQISRFHQASILSLKGGVRDILAHQHKPKPNSTLCASQVSYLYQKSISLGFSLLYIHMF